MCLVHICVQLMSLCLWVRVGFGPLLGLMTRFLNVLQLLLLGPSVLARRRDSVLSQSAPDYTFISTDE